MTNPLRWLHPAADIPEGGLDESRSATAAERAALAGALGLLSCEDLTVRYEIRRIGAESFRLTGELAADVVQACVVTLDPVAAAIREPLAVEFRPATAPPAAPTGESAVLDVEDDEPLEAGRIDVGRVAYEVLSAALDPYPRKPGAELAWQDRNAGGDEKPEGPFAALKKLERPG